MDTNKPVRREIDVPSVFEGAFTFPMFRRLGREIDFLFDRFGLERNFVEPVETVWTPDLEMFRRGADIVVRADVPGMKKEEVTVELADGQLMLRGERKQEKEENNEGYYRTERTYGSFYRTLTLPEGVKVDEAKAVIRDGVLEVVIPTTKVEDKKRRLVIDEAAPPKTTTKQAA
jgi:HSP20 family protein